MPNYLFDTSCFYSISSKEINFEKIKNDNSNILACPLSVLEIARSKNDSAEFERRKSAMINLKKLITLFIPKSTDFIIQKSYNQISEEDNYIINSEDIINCMIYAKNYEEAEKGIIINNKPVKLKFDELHKWKKELSDRFSSIIVEDDKAILETIKAHMQDIEDKTEREIKRSSKERYKEIAGSEWAEIYMIAGLGVRAGLFTEEEYKNSIIENGERYIQFAERALTNYNYSLQSYIKIYLEFRKEKLLNAPDRNDLFDLEFLIYLDTVGDCIFVTKEPKWVKIANRVVDNKLMHIDDFLKLYRN